MGLDLSLLPIFIMDENDICFSHSVIELNRRSTLFEVLLKMGEEKGVYVPKNFSSYLCKDVYYEEPHYGKTIEDDYGNPLKYVEVKDLLEFKDYIGIIDDNLNRAVWSYLKELSKNIKIVLFWH